MTKLKLLVACFVLFILGLSPVMAQTDGIQFFNGTWSEAVTKAKAENKLIFIDFYTQWCGPCFNMAENVFVLPSVGDFYNNSFINMKIDAETADGSPLAKKYGVKSYPSYLYVDPKTEDAVHKSGSRQSPEQFITTGKSALQPNRRSFYLESEYEKGNRDTDLLLAYVEYQSSIYQRDKVREAFDIVGANGKNLIQPKVWEVFVSSISGNDNPYLQYVSDHYNEFVNAFGKKAVDDKLTAETAYMSLENIDKLCDFEGKAFNKAMININQLERKKNYDQAAIEIDKMIADPTVDQQKLIDRLVFTARSGINSTRVPDSWKLKCLEYIRYIAYNKADRNDAHIHYEYAAALENILKSLDATKCDGIPAFIQEEPSKGVTVYTMRPTSLKAKPKKN